jgi:hypothetical protein
MKIKSLSWRKGITDTVHYECTRVCGGLICSWAIKAEDMPLQEPEITKDTHPASEAAALFFKQLSLLKNISRGLRRLIVLKPVIRYRTYEGKRGSKIC